MPLYGRGRRAPLYALPFEESFPAPETEAYRSELRDLITASREWIELHCGITLTTIERGYVYEAANSVAMQFATNYQAERSTRYLIDYPPREVAYRFLHTAYDMDWHQFCDSIRCDALAIFGQRRSAGVAASMAAEQHITLPTQALMQRKQAELHHE